MSADKIAKRLANARLPCPACDLGGVSDCMCSEYAYPERQAAADIDWLLGRLSKTREYLELSSKDGEWGDANLQDEIAAFLKEDESDATPLSATIRTLTAEVQILAEELRCAMWGLQQLKDLSPVAREAICRVNGVHKAVRRGVQYT